MAKQTRLLPARPREAVDDSVLIRSAQTLGRMIGSLQRQLDGAKKSIPLAPNTRVARASVDGDGDGRRTVTAEAPRPKTRGRARAAGAGRSSSGAIKTQSTADRKSKRASKSARAKKSAGRSGSRKK